MNNFATKLPIGWTEVPIADLFLPLEDGRTLHQGWSPQCEKEPSQAEDQWGVLKTTAIQVGVFLPEHNKLLPRHLNPRPVLEVKKGDILITCAGPRVRCGVVCLVRNTRGRLMISGKMYRFRVRTDRIDPRYLEAYLRTKQVWDSINRMKTGISDSGLNLTHDRFRRLSVRVAPLNEQHRIVAEIEKQFSRLDGAVANLKRVKANLKRYKAAVLKAAVEGKLTEEWRKAHSNVEPARELLKHLLTERRAKWNGKGKYKEPVVPDTMNLPSLPDTWTWATIDQLSEIVTKGSSPNWQGFDYCENGIVFVRSQNVEWGKLSLTDVARLPVEFNQKERKSVLKTGDVLFNIVGASIGRAAIASPETQGGNVNQAVAVIRLLPNSALNSYLMFYLISVQAQKKIHAEKVDVARANFSLEDTRSLAVPLPPPVEQTRIVTEVERQLSMIDDLHRVAEVNLQRAECFRQALFAMAFSGGLSGKVKVDADPLASEEPTDESA